MSKAMARSAPSTQQAATDTLGPARVLGVTGPRVRIELPDGAEATALLALAFPYRPAPGDTLLVIGKGDNHYVIGVLEGHGQTDLALPGGVAIRAEGGALSLSGDEGVRIHGPEVDIEARTLRITAGALVQKLTSLYQRVSALLSVRAREAETIIDETSLTRARSATILTEETMSINGKQIHLG